jgi:hypothetical protein
MNASTEQFCNGEREKVTVWRESRSKIWSRAIAFSRQSGQSSERLVSASSKSQID